MQNFVVVAAWKFVVNALGRSRKSNAVSIEIFKKLKAREVEPIKPIARHKSQVSFTKAILFKFLYRGILLKEVILQIDRASMIPLQTVSLPSVVRNTVAPSADHGRDHFCNLVQNSKSTSEVSTSNCKDKHSANQNTQANTDKESAKTAFKTMLVAQFLEPLFEGYTESMFGEGVESDMYKSLFSEAVAKSVAKSDGIGIGNYFDDK